MRVHRSSITLTYVRGYVLKWRLMCLFYLFCLHFHVVLLCILCSSLLHIIISSWFYFPRTEKKFLMPTYLHTHMPRWIVICSKYSPPRQVYILETLFTCVYALLTTALLTQNIWMQKWKYSSVRLISVSAYTTTTADPLIQRSIKAQLGFAHSCSKAFAIKGYILASGREYFQPNRHFLFKAQQFT